MQSILVMFRSDGQRRSFSVTRDMTVVGRREDCDLRIPLGEVSRKHARLVRDGDTLRLEDLGSSNGTFLNGQRVQEAVLSAGDSVQIGPVVFVLQIDGMPADEDLRPITADIHDQAAVAPAASERSTLAPTPRSDAGGMEQGLDALEPMQLGHDDHNDDLNPHPAEDVALEPLPETDGLDLGALDSLEDGHGDHPLMKAEDDLDLAPQPDEQLSTKATIVRPPPPPVAKAPPLPKASMPPPPPPKMAAKASPPPPPPPQLSTPVETSEEESESFFVMDESSELDPGLGELSTSEEQSLSDDYPEPKSPPPGRDDSASERLPLLDEYSDSEPLPISGRHSDSEPLPILSEDSDSESALPAGAHPDSEPLPLLSENFESEPLPRLDAHSASEPLPLSDEDSELESLPPLDDSGLDPLPPAPPGVHSQSGSRPHSSELSNHDRVPLIRGHSTQVPSPGNGGHSEPDAMSLMNDHAEAEILPFLGEESGFEELPLLGEEGDLGVDAPHRPHA